MKTVVETSLGNDIEVIQVDNFDVIIDIPAPSDEIVVIHTTYRDENGEWKKLRVSNYDIVEAMRGKTFTEGYREYYKP